MPEVEPTLEPTTPEAPSLQSVPPPVQARAQKIAAEVDDGEIDIVEAILKSYREGVKDGSEKTKAKKIATSAKKSCFWCAGEGCSLCA